MIGSLIANRLRRDRHKERSIPLPVLPNGGAGFDSYHGLIQAVQSAGGQLIGGPGTPSPLGPDFMADNGPVFSLIATRLLVFAEARFQFQQLRDGRPGNLFGSPRLSVLERPWHGGTTGDMLSMMEVDVSLAGNSYWTMSDVPGDLGLIRFDPKHVKPVYEAHLSPGGSPVGVNVLGYMVFMPGSSEPTFYEAKDVAHYKPIPHPSAPWVGMSWLTPVITDVVKDHRATEFLSGTLFNQAVPRLAVKFPATASPEQVEAFKEKFDDVHKGPTNAGKSIFLGGGADLTPVGLSMKDLDLRALQGSGETRIAAAAGVPPVIAGFSEGLASATYSNYGQARRRFADGTMRPLWRSAAGALERLVGTTPGARLWYDDRDIPFLQEDVKDDAEIKSNVAGTINTLVSAGFDPDAAVDAATSGDMSRLTGKHSGLFSVQLQGAGTTSSGEG